MAVNVLLMRLLNVACGLRSNQSRECSSTQWRGPLWQLRGKATIRVARLGDQAVVSRIYRSSRFGKARRFHGHLTHDDWSRLEDAVVAANFWMLDEHGGRRGLDGSTWRFAGRRRCDFHFISRWSPDGELWELGRLFFDVAGLGDVRLS